MKRLLLGGFIGGIIRTWKKYAHVVNNSTVRRILLLERNTALKNVFTFTGRKEPLKVLNIRLLKSTQGGLRGGKDYLQAQSLKKEMGGKETTLGILGFMIGLKNNLGNQEDVKVALQQRLRSMIGLIRVGIIKGILTTGNAYA